VVKLTVPQFRDVIGEREQAFLAAERISNVIRVGGGCPYWAWSTERPTVETIDELRKTGACDLSIVAAM
jgi:hypothetical protein